MSVKPLAFPSDAAGWSAFVADRPVERVARVREIDALLTGESASTTLERLERWNDAEIALREALSESYVLSESHPDASVREVAEAQAQAVEALQPSGC